MEKNKIRSWSSQVKYLGDIFTFKSSEETPVNFEQRKTMD